MARLFQTANRRRWRWENPPSLFLFSDTLQWLSSRGNNGGGGHAKRRKQVPIFCRKKQLLESPNLRDGNNRAVNFIARTAHKTSIFHPPVFLWEELDENISPSLPQSQLPTSSQRPHRPCYVTGSFVGQFRRRATTSHDTMCTERNIRILFFY